MWQPGKAARNSHRFCTSLPAEHAAWSAPPGPGWEVHPREHCSLRQGVGPAFQSIPSRVSMAVSACPGRPGLSCRRRAANLNLLPLRSAQAAAAAAAAAADDPPPFAAPLQAQAGWEPLTGPLPPALIPPLAVGLLSTGLLIRCGCWLGGSGCLPICQDAS